MSWSLIERLRLALASPRAESGAPAAAAPPADAGAEREESLAAAGRPDEAWRLLCSTADRYEAEGRMLSAIVTYGRMLSLRPADPDLLDRIDDVSGGSALVPEEEFNTEGPVTASPCLRRKAPLFSEFDSEELLEILGAIELRELAAGEQLFREGDPCDALHLVVSGEIALTRSVPGLRGPSAETCRVREGQIAGALSRVPVDVRAESALAARSSRVLRLGIERLAPIFERHPQVWRTLDEYQSIVLEPVLVLG